jgi:hypothetical protein
MWLQTERIKAAIEETEMIEGMNYFDRNGLKTKLEDIARCIQLIMFNFMHNTEFFQGLKDSSVMLPTYHQGQPVPEYHSAPSTRPPSSAWPAVPNPDPFEPVVVPDESVPVLDLCHSPPRPIRPMPTRRPPPTMGESIDHYREQTRVRDMQASENAAESSRLAAEAIARTAQRETEAAAQRVLDAIMPTREATPEIHYVIDEMLMDERIRNPSMLEVDEIDPNDAPPHPDYFTHSHDSTVFEESD